MRTPREFICRHCGSSFSSINETPKFCSSACFGKEYTKSHTSRDRSEKIIEAYRSGKHSINSICRTFHISRPLAKRILIDAGETVIGQSEIQSLLRNNGIGNFPVAAKRPCGVCGKPFIWYPCYYGRRGKFCSRECYANDPGRASRQRQRALEMIASDRFRTERTKPEKLMAEILDFHEVEYEPQFVLGPFCYDFYWPEMGLMLEVDGEYWHGYNVPEQHLRPWHARNAIRDKAKDNYAKKCGLEVWRIPSKVLMSNRVNLMEVR